MPQLKTQTEIEKQKNRKIREAKGLFDAVPFLVPEKIQKNTAARLQFGGCYHNCNYFPVCKSFCV